MVKFNSFFIAVICACSTWYSAHGILVEGSRWTLGNKEILFLFDIHNEPGFEEFEREELETFIGILKMYSQTDNRPLYILVEESANVDSVIGPLRKRLAQEEITNIIVENIEQRAASASASDLLSAFPDHRYITPRTSATQTCYAQKVTMEEVLQEYALIKTSVEESYKGSSDTVKGIHDERVCDITCLTTRIMEKIKNMSIALDQPLASLLETCSSEELVEYRTLGRLIFSAASAYIDLYAFHRVLLLPDDYRVVLLAGGRHCAWVKSRMMGRLDATKNFGYGKDGDGLVIKGDILQPIQAEQLKSLICT
ncbi:hypothetical protein H0W26_06045 [Candidatus Dependentiae bacterium]|nr:hypothetical protein [Candidatus Dependentiae bacterium]